MIHGSGQNVFVPFIIQGYQEGDSFLPIQLELTSEALRRHSELFFVMNFHFPNQKSLLDPDRTTRTRTLK